MDVAVKPSFALMWSVTYERWLPLSNKIRTGMDLDRSSFVAIAVAVCNKMLPLALAVDVAVTVLPKDGVSFPSSGFVTWSISFVIGSLV